MRKILFIISFITMSFVFSAQNVSAVSVDTSFGVNGKTVTSSGANSSVGSLLIRTDGSKVVVGQKFNGANDDWLIAKYNVNGQLDTSFGDNGLISKDFGGNAFGHSDFLHAIVSQPDGSFLVGGGSSVTVAKNRWTIARYTQGGNIDTSFGSGGIITTSLRSGSIIDYVNDLIVQSDGKIVAVGVSHVGETDVAVVRYNADGSLDTTFGSGGIVTTPMGGNNDRGKVGVVQPDGKIVVLGDFDAGQQVNIFLVRYLTDGSLDASFGSGGKVSAQISGYDGGNDLVLQQDGKILVAGGTNYNGLHDTYVARFNANGSLDNTFGSGGKVVTSFSVGSDASSSLLLQGDNKIVLGGYEHRNGTIDFVLRRYNTDGTPDTNFGTNGSYVTQIGQGDDSIQALAMQNDGKIVAAGNTSNGSYNDWALVRYTNGQSTILDVPLFKQGIAPYTDSNPSWEGDEFDSASLGQFGCGITMAECGCSTTSIAMVFNFHKVNKLPNGTAITPGTLNAWLKQNEGYNRNIGVIWPVAATLAYKAKAQNPDFAYDALEYDIDTKYNAERLTNDLQNNIPNILEVKTPGMHFIVATGKDAETFTINDPFFNRTSLAAYNNTAKSVRRYVPANSDMSYIVYTVDESVSIAVKDQNGVVVGESYVEYSPANVVGEPTISTSSGIRSYYFAKPSSGTYKVTLSSSSSTNYQLDETLITENGDVTNKTFTGLISSQNPKSFSLFFDKEESSNSKTNEHVTFATTLADIKHLRERNDLHYSLAIVLTADLKNAEKLYKMGRIDQAGKLLDVGIKLINSSPKRFFGEGAKEILLNDFNALKLLIKNKV